MKSFIIPIIIAVVVVAMSWMNTLSAISTASGTIESYIQIAEENEALKVYKVALTNYMAAQKLDEGNIYYYHKIMDLAYISQRYELFEDVSRDTIKKFPSDSKAYLDLCKYFYDIKDDSKAVVDLALKAKENLTDSSEFQDMYYEMAYRYDFLGSEYDEVRGFIGTTAPVKKEGKWGLLNKSGSYLIKPQYLYISAYSDGKAAVEDESGIYYIDQYNDKILASEEPVDMAYPFINGLAVVKKDDTYGYTTSDFKLKDMKWEFATSYLNGVAAIKKDGKWALRDINKNMITDFQFEDVVYDENLIISNAKVIFAKENGLYYLFDLEGKKIIDKGFDDVKPFAFGGIAPVKLDGKWGYIDSLGGKIIEPKFDDADSFGMNVAPVKIDDHWVYINKSERVLIEGNFEEAKPFSSAGIAPVKINGYWTYIKLLSAK